jgi:hypothetical protein
VGSVDEALLDELDHIRATLYRVLHR